jgi:hypothetical protein
MGLPRERELDTPRSLPESDEVPTGFLKAEYATTAPGKLATTRTVEFIEFKTP